MVIFHSDVFYQMVIPLISHVSLPEGSSSLVFHMARGSPRGTTPGARRSLLGARGSGAVEARDGDPAAPR